MEDLPEDLAVEILSRLPARLLCCCKCVSRSWRCLISHPAHGGRLEQTLSGFFFRVHTVFRAPSTWAFAGLSSIWAGLPPPVDSDLSFLPPSYSRRSTELMDSCNGLLLLRCIVVSHSQPPPPAAPFFYVVCNPTTKEWVKIPEPSHAAGSGRTRHAALGFDPAVSSHFHVFQLVVGEADEARHNHAVVEAVEIFSSETGEWALSASGWTGHNHVASCTGRFAYLNGFLHFATANGAVAAVDTAGQAWRVTRVGSAARRAVTRFCRRDACGFVARSRGRLLYVTGGDPDDAGDDGLSVYALVDYGGDAWALELEQSISAVALFGPSVSTARQLDSVVAIHPDGNLIFFFDDGSQRVLRAYDMDRKDVRVIRFISEASQGSPLLPYVPLYSTALLGKSNVR